MTTQPEALRLANLLDNEVTPEGIEHAAAAELRRLHAQREVLLKALKYVYKELRRYGRHNWSEAVRAQTAIKQVEEKA